MGLERIELATGPVDGVNLTFYTSMAYTPGTVRVFWNGRARRATDADGWTEIDAVTGQVDLRRVPRIGDIIQIFYVDTLPDSLPQQQVVCLWGALPVQPVIYGNLPSLLELTGALPAMVLLDGMVQEYLNLTGSTGSATVDIQGQIKETC